MNGRKLLALGVASAALIAAVVFLNYESSVPGPATAKLAESESPIKGIAPEASTTSVDAPSHAVANSPAAIEESTAEGQTFHVDAAGNLVLDEQTRLNIEALVAQNESRELYAAVREQTEQLPPAAAKRAEELVDKFVSYQQAQRQAYPPSDVPATPEDAIRQLEGLHALREAHFGPEVAHGFYGKEEIIAREMIEVMRVENDQSLTPEEKAERARALRERLPGVSAIEKNNRESDPTPKK